MLYMRMYDVLLAELRMSQIHQFHTLGLFVSILGFCEQTFLFVFCQSAAHFIINTNTRIFNVQTVFSLNILF
jgi:hypothetical protein